jgi:hypothetical protein
MSDDTSINIVDDLKGQHLQLRRLLAKQSWIASASRDTLSEIDTQLTQIKSVLRELERVIAASRTRKQEAQKIDRTELYRSPNGDCWYLPRDQTAMPSSYMNLMFPPADGHLASKLQTSCEPMPTGRNIRRSYG